MTEYVLQYIKHIIDRIVKLAVQAWNPYPKKGHFMLRSTKMVSELRNLEYSDTLRILNLRNRSALAANC